MIARAPMAPVVAKLMALIDEHGWHGAFDLAIQQAGRDPVPSLAHIETLADYLHFIDDMVRWAPREVGDSRMVHDKLVEFHYFFAQPSLRRLQSPTQAATTGQPRSPLSQWIVEYACAWGAYLDTPESAAHVDSFRGNPAFHWDDYMPPPSGYRSFNQFFARHVKPGYRPVADAHCATAIVAPADSVHMGQWRVAPDATIDVKGLRWSIEQLLEGSPYAQRFAGGLFTHSVLRTFDYHRWHAPVAGKVVEARVVQGRAWLDVVAVKDEHGVAKLEAVEGTGFQFDQMRGLVVIESAVGLVACLPVGMAQVSSVVINAEVGRTLSKGEGMGYFQFGGSDFVMVFEADSDVLLTCETGQHGLQGSRVGTARPTR